MIQLYQALTAAAAAATATSGQRILTQGRIAAAH